MDPLRLALTNNKHFWFGVLVDINGRLAASAVHSTRNSVRDYLTSYARKTSGSNPRETEHELSRQMSALFEGDREAVSFNMDLTHISDFQKKVYDILVKIPRGRVTQYGLIARTLTSGPRAVGTAVASNPWPIFVPCHRVVPFNLIVGNYSFNGSPSPEGSLIKKKLLEREGVEFEGDRITPASIWNSLEG